MKTKRKPIKLIERNIAKIKAEAAKSAYGDHFAFDTEIKGFGLRVQNGRASWVMQYQVHGRQHRIKLGDQAVMSADVARSAATKAAGKIADSRDTGAAHPILEKKRIADEMARAEAKRPGDTPFGSRIEEYLAARTGNGNGLRERSVIETRRYLETAFKELHKIPLNQIRKSDVVTVLNAIKYPVARNRGRSTLSKFFAWAIGESLCDVNPVIGTNKAEEGGGRKRVLTNDEIATVWLNAPDTSYGTILKLLLLTGCRRDEIGGLMWNEVDLNARTITIPGARTKNKQEHVVPLSDTAMSILAGIPVRQDRQHIFGRRLAGGFGGWPTAKARFDAVLKIEPWVVHDLRRTAATQMAELGVQPHIIEACLNHISGHKAGVAGIYNKATYATEKRNALNAWANHIKVIIAQATGANVTALKKKQR